MNAAFMPLLIIVILAVLALALAGGVAAKGKTPASDFVVRDQAEDALRAAADFVGETGSEPFDVEVHYDPVGVDGQWVVELIWQ